MKNSYKLGDIVASVTKLLGLKHCEKCEKRRQILNDLGKAGLRDTAHRLQALEKELKDCCK